MNHSARCDLYSLSFCVIVAEPLYREIGSLVLLCPMSRSQLLQFLPKGGEVAEIGVANGDFSQSIVDTAAPRRLHLIDPWEHQERVDYAKDDNNVSDPEQEARFESVSARFRDEISRGTVCVHRDYSEDAAIFFADGQLDWVYIDGMHTLEAAYRDLTVYQSKVKHDGFIVGHDYTNHVQAQYKNFGVVEAVNRFIVEFGYEFLALTIEAFPTYVLAKNSESAVARNLTHGLIINVPYVVEIRDFPRDRRFEHKALWLAGGPIVYQSF
jgi:hypothetical protein